MPKCSRCHRSITGTYTLCYSCMLKKKEKSFQTHGTGKCKKCGTRIAKDHTYCYPHYREIMEKPQKKGFFGRLFG